MRIEIDYRNKIIDIYVEKDENCSISFLNKETNEAHEGLKYEQFLYIFKPLIEMIERQKN